MAYTAKDFFLHNIQVLVLSWRENIEHNEGVCWKIRHL
jgi:hypothetical protein